MELSNVAPSRVAIRVRRLLDDTRRYVDALGLEPETRAQVCEHNARRVYSRLKALR